MSRCFPYPPPGHERNGTRDKALIESIKKEREKERRKEKKGKKKDKASEDREIETKKDSHGKRHKAREDREIEKKKDSHGKRHKDERSKVDQKGGDHQKKREDVTEQLEKSGVTEELGQPVSSQNLYDSSDNTQNSNKRKRHNSPSNGSHSHGSIVRIRLPLQKHKDPEVPSGNEQSRSASGLPHNAAQEIASRPCKDQPCSTSGRTETLAQEKAETAPTSSFFQNGSLQIESHFRDLIDNWIPPPLQIESFDFDDQEWLFEPNQQQRHMAKRFKARTSGSCNGNSNLWPSACYLPEAEIYALPFTVPY